MWRMPGQAMKIVFLVNTTESGGREKFRARREEKNIKYFMRQQKTKLFPEIKCKFAIETSPMENPFHKCLWGTKMHLLRSEFWLKLIHLRLCSFLRHCRHFSVCRTTRCLLWPDDDDFKLVLTFRVLLSSKCFTIILTNKTAIKSAFKCQFGSCHQIFIVSSSYKANLISLPSQHQHSYAWENTSHRFMFSKAIS